MPDGNGAAASAPSPTSDTMPDAGAGSEEEDGGVVPDLGAMPTAKKLRGSSGS